MTEIAVIVLLALLAVVVVLVQRRKKRARMAVNAECLACTYVERFEDVTAARKAGNMHGEKTGHPLMLVQA